MAGMLTLDELRKAVGAGEIDTVLAVQVDMQGRLMGKRFQAEYFLDSASKETHSCNYLLATDLEMATPDGYVPRDHFNVGFAVALDDGLIVPVIRNAEQLTLAEIEAAIRGMTPWPGAFTFHGEQRLKILMADALTVPAEAAPGRPAGGR